MWSEGFFAKIEFLPQRSLQNLRVNAINEHGYCHLFIHAMKFISLVFVKYCPALDKNLEAWVQSITLGNNQVATKFTFCCQFLSLLQKRYYCRWASWRQGLWWGLETLWVSSQQTQEGEKQPPVTDLSCSGGCISSLFLSLHYEGR